MATSRGRGQSEVIGTMLLLGITVITLTFIVVIAGAALDDTRSTTDVESTEHAMSQLDSRAALVALGRTESQSIAMGRARTGTYSVDGEAGWIRITHNDYDAATADEELYNGTLGAIEYTQGDRAIAYQGGGVWRSDGGNGSVLVSPPEFHYRGETLTIPVIQVRAPTGSGSASGAVTAKLTRDYTSHAIYPNRSASYDAISRNYINPVQNGSLSVTVHSEYYQAWGDYFRERTEGDVSIDHPNETATVSLTVPAVKGNFDMPLDGDTLVLRGTGGRHAVTDLNLTLSPDDSDSASFSNLKWSLYAQQGSKELELHLRGGGSSDCGDPIRGTVYFSDGGGTYQGWTNGSAFSVACADYNDDGDDEARVVANWSKPINFTYTDLSSSDLLYYNPSGSTLADPVTFDQHQDTVDWEPVTYTEGDPAPVNGTVSHYAGLYSPSLELTVHDSGADTVNEESSSGTVNYGGATDTFVTYVHATENRLNVTFT